MYDDSGQLIEMANQAKQIVKVKVPFAVEPQSLLRKVE
jgi:hypothetical protein